MTKRSIIFILSLLVLLISIDIGIKAVIYNNYFDSYFDIVGEYLGYSPQINRNNLSTFNSVLHLGIPFNVVLIGNILAIPVIIPFWVYIKKNIISAKYMIFNNIFLSFFEAAIICSLIDKLWLGGSLDYIKIGKWVYDLKDFYSDVGEIGYVGLTVFLYIKDPKKTSSVSKVFQKFLKMK